MSAGVGRFVSCSRSIAARSLEAGLTLQMPVFLSSIVCADRFLRSVMQTGATVVLGGVRADVPQGVQEETAQGPVRRKQRDRNRSLLLRETPPRRRPLSISTGITHINRNMSMMVS